MTGVMIYNFLPIVSAMEAVVAIGVAVVARTCEFKGLGVLDNSNAFEFKANPTYVNKKK